jgi:putative transposase
MAERTMKELGRAARKRRRFVTTADSDHGRPLAQNLLVRDFERNHLDTIWLSDINFLPMHGGVVIYLCVIMDLGSRAIVRWQIAIIMNTELGILQSI